MSNNIWGATPREWSHFAGLCSQDLLPVVSNPNAKIATNSALVQLGKVPTRYNHQRCVVGLAGWPERVNTPLDIQEWSREPDYGICIRTRNIRALDIDIEDAEEAEEVKEFLSGLGLPMRFRENASKFLLAFVLVGDYPKRSFKTRTGLIEFLGSGQQFIACGTHPSGSRYEWQGGLPVKIPTLDEAGIMRVLMGLV